MEEQGGGAYFFKGLLIAIGVTLPFWLIVGAVIVWVVSNGR